MDVPERFLDGDALRLAERFTELDEVRLLTERIFVHDEDDTFLEDLTVTI